MRRTLILMLAALGLSVALCAGSMRLLDAAVDRAETLGNLAILAEEEGRDGDARTLMHHLAQHWRDRADLLELIASHDALHEVETAIAEAQICLECDDRDDFLRMMSTLRGALAHIRDAEALRWSNLY